MIRPHIARQVCIGTETWHLPAGPERTGAQFEATKSLYLALTAHTFNMNDIAMAAGFGPPERLPTDHAPTDNAAGPPVDIAERLQAIHGDRLRPKCRRRLTRALTRLHALCDPADIAFAQDTLYAPVNKYQSANKTLLARLICLLLAPSEGLPPLTRAEPSELLRLAQVLDWLKPVSVELRPVLATLLEKECRYGEQVLDLVHRGWSPDVIHRALQHDVGSALIVDEASQAHGTRLVTLAAHTLADRSLLLALITHGATDADAVALATAATLPPVLENTSLAEKRAWFVHGRPAAFDAAVMNAARRFLGLEEPPYTDDPAFGGALLGALRVLPSRGLHVPLFKDVLRAAWRNRPLHTWPKNKAWRDRMETRGLGTMAWSAGLDVHTTLTDAAGTQDIHIHTHTPILTLLADLRDFGPCGARELRLESASMVLNIADDNKHVLRVEAAGVPIAQQVLTLDDDKMLIRYRLEHELEHELEPKLDALRIALQDALHPVLRAFADRIGARLATEPVPEPPLLHAGGWFEVMDPAWPDEVVVHARSGPQFLPRWSDRLRRYGPLPRKK